MIIVEKMRDLANCLIPAIDYEMQKIMVNVTSRNWLESVKDELSKGSKAPDVTGYIPDAKYLAGSAKWCKEPFGAANDMEHSACIVFIAKHLLDYYGVEVDMIDLKNLVVKKGYRAWKFEKASKTFYAPEATLEEAFQVLPEEVDRKQIHTLKDTEKWIGKPVGIGGMHILLDNIIAEYACCYRVRDTRLLFVNEAYKELKDGNMVPMRVDNAIYHGDATKREGHFVILVSIKDQMATVIDPSVGENVLPIHQLLQAATVAWKVRPRQKPNNYLKCPSDY